MLSSFAGKKIVVFSGGKINTKENILEETKAIKKSNGHGSMIGRNIFQRPHIHLDSCGSIDEEVMSRYRCRIYLVCRQNAKGKANAPPT